jgi:hypothetical protein
MFNAVNAKGQPFPSDSLLMSLLLSQQKMIYWLYARVFYKPHNHREVIKVEL